MSTAHWHDFEPARLRPAALRWLAAGAAILALHGLIAYGLLAHSPAQPPPSTAPAMLIELEPLAVNAPSSTPAPAGGQEASEDPDAAPAPESASAAPSQAAEESAEDAAAAPAAEPPPEPAAEAAQAADVPQVPEAPSPAPLPATRPERTPQERVTAIKPRAEPRPAKPQETRQAVRRQEPRERKPAPPKPRQAEQEARRAERSAARSGQGVQQNARSGSSQGAVARSGTGRAQTARGGAQGASASGARGAPSMSRATWGAMILAHLSRYKRPQGSNVGRPTVRFSLSPSGSVTSVSLAGSSGNGVLDREVVAMVRRASPFPSAPAGMGGGTFTVPVNFTSR